MVNRNAFALIRRFYPHVRPHMRYVWVMLVCLVLSSPLAIASPLIIRAVVDGVIEGGDRHTVWMLGIALLAMTCLSVGFGIVTGYSTRIFHVKVIRDLRERLYRHVQSLSLRYFQDKETGHLMSRLQDDAGSLGAVMADALGRVGVDALRAVLYTVMLFYVEWRMALGGLVFTALIFGFQWLISPRLRALSKAARGHWTALTESLHQSLTGHYLIQSSASELRETKRFARALHTSVRADVRRDMFSLGSDHVFALIAGVAPTLIILAGAFLISRAEFTVGGLFEFLMYLMQMFGCIAAIAGLNSSMQGSLAALERIFEVLDTRPEIVSPPNGSAPATFAGRVTFDHVSFGYDPARPVLRDVDFDFAPRTMVALVGPSGAGKTTLAQMLPRFYDPTAGRVLVDGHDLRTLDLRNYRRRVGIVPQEIFLFDRTVAENIAYGRPGATAAEIRHAAAAAHAIEFIETMEKGMETVIGERGVRLSGGQRQRLAIARELLRDPAILILDEATSSLDSESEALIQEALGTLLQGRTSFVIAHRLSTVMRADVILVLEQGRVVEQGRHAELVARGGLYSRLYRSQFERPLTLPTESLVR
jgi:ATP-binding cassette, subfamily B, bacterial MsbA